MSEPTNIPTLLGEALLEAIREAVKVEIRDALGNRQENKGNDKLFLTVKEAANFSRLAPSTIRLLIRKRQLKALQVGRRVIIKRADLEKYLEANPIEALPE